MNAVKDFCSGREVYIYGAGIWGRILAIYLKENSIEVNSFIVSSLKDNSNIKVLGHPVTDFNSAKRFLVGSGKAIVLAVGSGQRDNIIKLLNENGIQDYYVITDSAFSEMKDAIKYTNDYSFENNIDIVMYHRVADLPIDPRHLSLSPKCFEMHLKYYKENYFLIRTEDDWKDSKKSLAITFDDGHYDFYKNIVPLLEKYEIPATVFVTTGIIGEEAELWGDELEKIIYINSFRNSEFSIWDCTYKIDTDESRFLTMISIRNKLKNMPAQERAIHLKELSNFLKADMKARSTHRLMTAEEIRKCSQSPYVTIGAHTVTHCSLAHETRDRQYKEIKESKEKLESIIDKEVNVFAYPYGEKEDFTDETIELAESIGFKKIFAVCGGMTNTRYVNGRIPRNNVAYCKTEEELSRQLNYIEHIYGNAYV